MRVGSFSVLVSEGKERDSGHVQMAHGASYGIKLGNHGSVKCDAEVSVDGKIVGNFRVNAFGYINLERPSHDTGRFTFFKADSAQGEDAGASEITGQDKGLISVTFRPEKNIRPTSYGKHGALRSMEEKTSGGILSNPKPRSRNGNAGGSSCTSHITTQSCSAGVTGLTGKSEQTFYEVGNLDYDRNGETIISLRLVADMCEVRKLTAAPKGNPIPEPVE